MKTLIDIIEKKILNGDKNSSYYYLIKERIRETESNIENWYSEEYIWISIKESEYDLKMEKKYLVELRGMLREYIQNRIETFKK